MLYNLLGRLTWKAFKLYLHRSGPKMALAAGLAVGVVVVAGVAAKRAIGDGAEA